MYIPSVCSTTQGGVKLETSSYDVVMRHDESLGSELFSSFYLRVGGFYCHRNLSCILTKLNEGSEQ